MSIPTRAKLRAAFAEALRRQPAYFFSENVAAITAAVEVVLGPVDNDGLRPATARHRQNFLALADAILYPGRDAPVPAASTTDAEAKLQEIDAITRRISQLENAVRVMAELALSEVKEHKARHSYSEKRITDLLHGLGLTSEQNQ